MQPEEERLLGKTRSKRTQRDSTPKLISDDDEELELMKMNHELQNKVEKESGLEV